MLTVGIATIVITLVTIGVMCAWGGYAFAQAQQQRDGGGKSAQELKTELEDYKADVSEHFQTTATLFHEMTDQYRSVYEHMAAGAQQLGNTEQGLAQIESLRAGLLPVIEASVDEENAAQGGSPDSEKVDTEN